MIKNKVEKNNPAANVYRFRSLYIFFFLAVMDEVVRPLEVVYSNSDHRTIESVCF